MNTQPNQVAADIETIAVIDDDKDAAETACWAIEAAGYKPTIITGSYNDVIKLANVVRQKAQGALCDHRLAPYGLANFVGASLVAKLYDFGFPAILHTQYSDIDRDVSIRKWRQKIPILLSRDELNGEAISEGIRVCSAELHGEVSSLRKPYRTLIQILGITNESGQKVVDTIVPSWNPSRAVRFPISLIPNKLHARLTIGMWLFTYVNIGALDTADLYFDQFELAPEPNNDDGLA